MPGDPAMSARAHPHPWPRSSGPFFLLACRATASQSLQSDESQFEQRHPYKGIPSGLGLRGLICQIPEPPRQDHTLPTLDP
jgi:hypothetical protein